MPACISTKMAEAINGHFYKYTFAVREHTTRRPTATFANNIFSVNFNPQYIHVGYDITNISARPIQIIWDKAYIVIHNDSSKVITSSIALENADESPSPSEIQTGQALQGFVTPIDYIKNTGDKWVVTSFYPGHDESNSEATDWIMGLIGVDIFKLYLPVAINGETKIYRFTFYPIEMEKSIISLEPKQ